MSIVSLLRHIWCMLQAAILSTEEQPLKYRVSKQALWEICIAIGYIMACIFIGIKI